MKPAKTSKPVMFYTPVYHVKYRPAPRDVAFVRLTPWWTLQ